MAKEIPKEVDHFNQQLEMRYFSSVSDDDVPQKLALQDLFRELKVLKDQT